LDSSHSRPHPPSTYSTKIFRYLFAKTKFEFGVPAGGISKTLQQQVAKSFAILARGISKTLEQQVAKSFAIPARGISKTLEQQVAKSFANGSEVEFVH